MLKCLLMDATKDFGDVMRHCIQMVSVAFSGKKRILSSVSLLIW